MRLLILVPLLLVLTADASAQLGIGGQVGSPTGLSLKFGQGAGSVAIAVGWDLDDSVEAEAHYLLRDRRLQGSQTGVRVFYGPGAFVQSAGDDTRAGVSLGLGLSAFLAREIELYGLVSPRLQLIDETEFDVGGGLGLRLYL